MSYPIVAYSSIPNTEILEIETDIKQVGRGFVIWTHSDSNEIQVWYDGNAYMHPQQILSGCYLQRDVYVTLYGEDREKRCWHAVIDYTHKLRPANPGTAADNKLLLTCDQVDRILHGHPFAAIVEECLRADTDAQLMQLKREAVFAAHARVALSEIYRVNESGGTGSRRNVKDRILQLMPELASA